MFDIVIVNVIEKNVSTKISWNNSRERLDELCSHSETVSLETIEEL